MAAVFRLQSTPLWPMTSPLTRKSNSSPRTSVTVCHIFVVTMDKNIHNSPNYKVWEYLYTLRTPEGWVGGSAGITGILLLVILGIIFVLSQPFVREKGYFEVC